VAVALAGCGRWGYGDASGDVTGGPGIVDGGADAGSEVDAAPPPAYCAEVPALAAAPVIDGAVDGDLALIDLPPVAWLGAGSGVPAGQSARYAAAWRPDGLYVFVDVADTSRVVGDELAWCGDAVEVYVDADGAFPRAPSYDDPGTAQLILAAPPAGASSDRRGEKWCTGCAGRYPASVDGERFVSVATARGYAVEVLVTAAELGMASWSPADRVGFDLAIDVSTDSDTGLPCQVDGAYGSRLGQYFLRVDGASPTYPFATSRAFCTPATAP
jgi:hypothetical protein